MVAYQSGRYAEGLEFANRALAINPTLDKIHAHQADMLRLTGRLPEGIQAAEKSLQLNPRLLSVREWLIRAYRDQGQAELADQQKSILDRMDAAPTVQ
jgi:tetratricopeptide (TPR) repeat protein